LINHRPGEDTFINRILYRMDCFAHKNDLLDNNKYYENMILNVYIETAAKMFGYGLIGKHKQRRSIMPSIK